MEAPAVVKRGSFRLECERQATVALCPALHTSPLWTECLSRRVTEVLLLSAWPETSWILTLH